METKRLTDPAHLEAAREMQETINALHDERVAMNTEAQARAAKIQAEMQASMMELKAEIEPQELALAERYSAVHNAFMTAADVPSGCGWQADLTYLDAHGEVFLFRDEQVAKEVQ